MTDPTTDALNRAYRARESASAEAQTALAQVVATGDLPAETETALVDALWEDVPEAMRGPYEGSLANGLAIAFTRDDPTITAHISDELFNQQPLGVLLGDLHSHIAQRGTAVIADAYPRSADVEAHVMPVRHINLDIMPVPVWLAQRIDGVPDCTLSTATADDTDDA